MKSKVSSNVGHRNSIPERVTEQKANECEFVFANFHQGDSKFDIFSRGKQCTANACSALVYNYHNPLFNVNELCHRYELECFRSR